MNEQVTKSISQTLDGFQWILGVLVIVLIIYLIFKSNKNKHK